MPRVCLPALALACCGCSTVVQHFAGPPVPFARTHEQSDVVMLERMRHVRLTGDRVHQLDRWRVLINRSAGLSYARIEIPLSDREALLAVRARSYGAESASDVQELGPDTIGYAAPGSHAWVLYKSSRIATFDVPGVTVGDILEYEVETEVEDADTILPWFFDGRSDVKLSRYVIEFPNDTKITAAYAVGGRFIDKPPQVEITSEGTRWTWTETDLPALDADPALEPWGVRARQLWLSSATAFPDWAAVVRWYQTLTAHHEELDPALLALLTTDPPHDAAGWFKLVRDHIRYLAYYREELDGYRPHAPNIVLASRFGDCKDMATLLVALYRRAGIEAFPVLVRVAGDVTFPEGVPGPTAFNHAIVALPGSGGALTFVDPTNKMLSFGAIPRYLAGQPALLIRASETGLVRIPEATPEQNYERVIWRLKDAKHIELDVEVASEASDEWRVHMIVRTQPDLRSEVERAYLAPWPGARAVETSDESDDDRVRIHARVEAPELAWSAPAGRLIPLSRFFSGTIEVEGARTEEVTVIVPLAPNERVRRLPETRTASAGTIEVSIAAEVAGGEVRISRRVRRRSGGVGHPPAEIEPIIDALHRDAIVIGEGSAP